MIRYYTTTTALVLAAVLPANPAAAQERPAPQPQAFALVEALPTLEDMFAVQDPAQALYKQGRDELNRGRYAQAASFFSQVVTRYPRSSYAPDAYYWQAFALYRIGNESDLKTARALLEKQRSAYPKASTVTSNEAATLLARINGKLAEMGDVKAAENVARSASRVAAQPCPSDDDEDLRTQVITSFLNMNSEQAVPLLKKILERRDECSAGLREKAVFVISQKRGSDVEDVLLDVARNDPSAKVREQAVFWLSQVSGDRALGHLEQILKSAPDQRIADKAVFAISQHRSPRASQILRDYAMSRSADRNIREKAIFWIGQRSGDENTQFLKELYARETDKELKDKIIFALSQRRGNADWLMEVALNENESVEMRKKALFWAGQTSGISTAQLTGLYDRMRDREMKEQLIFVFSQRNDRAAVDKLMDIARRETDRELRKKAVFWLGQSKDPRAAEFLMELINQ